MGKKFGVNTKSEEGRARKAAVAEEKKRAAASKKEAEEAKSWEEGAYKNKRKEEEEAKRLQRLAKKKEREDLERRERAQLADAKTKNTPDSKPSPAAVGKERSIAVDVLRSVSSADSKKSISPSSSFCGDEPLATFSASNLDDALSLMETLTVDPSKDTIDRHPERRMKAAYAAFEAKEMPRLKSEHPGLRHSQLKEKLFRAWQKSPENPFNQAHISHTATREEERAAIRDLAEQDLERFRTK